MIDFFRQLFFHSIALLGNKFLRFVAQLGQIALFAGAVCRDAIRPPFRLAPFWREMHKSGVLSLPIICLGGLAVGMVLGLEGYHTLTRFGAERSLGAMVGMSLIRELGPVVAALLITGRAGSAMTAEIGAMVATEQLDGLRMLSIDPIHYVIKPRVLAMAASCPLLTGLFITSGIAGGYIAGVTLLHGDAGFYFSSLRDSVDLSNDLGCSFVKALAFGVLLSIIAAYRGYHAQRTSEGVSRATTETVVTASIAVLMFDYMITALWGV